MIRSLLVASRWLFGETYFSKFMGLKRVCLCTRTMIYSYASYVPRPCSHSSSYNSCLSSPCGQYFDGDESAMQGCFRCFAREIEGRYPGGKDRQFERWKLLSSAIRGVAVSCLQARAWNEAWRIYRRSFWMHVRWDEFALGRLSALQFAFHAGSAESEIPAAFVVTVPRGIESAAFDMGSSME